MNESAIILAGKQVQKVSNLKRKYDKLISNPDIKILEECLKSELDNKFEYWKEQYKEEKVEFENNNLYKFYNPETKETLLSIYPDLETIKSLNVIKGAYEGFIPI